MTGFQYRDEIDLVVVSGWSKLAWFLNAGRKLLVFSVIMQIDLHFVWFKLT